MAEGQGSEGNTGSGQGQGTQNDGSQQNSNEPSGQGQGGTGGQAPPTVPENFDPERAMATILAQRQNEAALKQQLQEAQAKIKAAEDAEKTELQREKEAREAAEKKLQDLEAAAKISEAKSQVAATASTLGFVAPDLAYRLIDLDKLPQKDGKPDAEGALRDLLKQYPSLAVAGSGDGGAGGRPPGRKGDMNAIIRGTRSGKS